MNSITYFVQYGGECIHIPPKPLCWCHAQRLAYRPEVPRDIPRHLMDHGLVHIGELASFPLWQGSLEDCMDALAGLPGWAVGGFLVSFRIHPNLDPKEKEWILSYLNDCWIRVIHQQSEHQGIAMADLDGIRHAMRVSDRAKILTL